MHSRRDFVNKLALVAAAAGMPALCEDAIRWPSLASAAVGVHPLDAIARDDPATVLSELLGHLTDRNPRVRTLAIDWLGKSREVWAIDALARIVAQGHHHEAVHYALGWIAA